MPLIETRALTKIYRMGDTDVRALDGVNLVIEEGEFIAITGASGSGKSTMMHLLGCLDRPTGGQILLNGRDVSLMSDRELASVRNNYIGFVFQTFNLINRTSAVENVGVPLFYGRKSNTRESARQALERVGLAHRGKHKPAELSGGERQRVAIARAIVNNPLLIFADEPTGNLDSRTGEQIMEVFRGLNAQGVTIVLVTHEPEVAMQARRIVQMRDGKIVADNLTSELEAPAKSTATRGTFSPIGSPEGVTAEPIPVAASGSPAIATAVPIGRPTAEQETARDYSHLESKPAHGATATLICGVFAITMLLAVYVLSVAASMAGYKPDPRGATFNPPPPIVIVLGLSNMLAILLCAISGVMAIFWARGVRKRIREQPGNWTGGRKALLGGILGAVAVGLPILSVVVRLAIRMMR